MKKLLIVSALALGLASCNIPNTQNITTVIADVQAATVLACKFEPTVTTIVAIITANQSATVTQIANLVCAAVNGVTPTPKQGAGPMYVVINGQKIPVTGNFVR